MFSFSSPLTPVRRPRAGFQGVVWLFLNRLAFLFTTPLTQNTRAFLSVSGTGWKEERVGLESDPEAEVFLAVECWEAAAAAATTAGEAAL